MTHLLLVDDEVVALAALKRELLALQAGLTIDTSTSPTDALAKAGSQKYDLVIADYQMSEMDGVAFLKALQAIQPRAVGLMLSDALALDQLANAINCAHIYRFIGKPWNALELSEVIRQALGYQAALAENHRLAELFHQEYGRPPPLLEADRYYQILVVDDEVNVLNAVSRTLGYRSTFGGLHAGLQHKAIPSKPMSHDFRFVVETCSSPVEALARAAEVTYDLVMTDYRMPEMDGIVFLEAFRQLQPDAMRLMLSGQADSGALIDAINKSEIYAFINKPWSGYALKSLVSEAIAYRNVLMENRRLAERLARKHLNV